MQPRVIYDPSAAALQPITSASSNLPSRVPQTSSSRSHRRLLERVRLDQRSAMAPQFCSDCGTILDISAQPTIACDICGTSQKSNLPPPTPTPLPNIHQVPSLLCLPTPPFSPHRPSPAPDQCNRQAPQHRHHHALRARRLPLGPAQPAAGARARRAGHGPGRADHQHGVPAQGVRRPRGGLEPGAAAQRRRGHHHLLRVPDVRGAVRVLAPRGSRGGGPRAAVEGSWRTRSEGAGCDADADETCRWQENN